MARGFERDGGGIFWLLDLIEEQPEAVEYDLISHGLRLRDLGTDRLWWRDLMVIVRMQPRSSALTRITEPEAAEWGLTEQLLAEVADMLHIRVWQSGKARKSDQPKPIPRPGVETGSKTVHKHDILPVSEMADWLGDDFAAMVA